MTIDCVYCGRLNIGYENCLSCGAPPLKVAAERPSDDEVVDRTDYGSLVYACLAKELPRVYTGRLRQALSMRLL